jgi:capsular polysaccharide biosynthesis protein
VEIKDYLRALGKRAWVVILVPVIAGALALGYQLGQRPSYQSTVTVLSHPASAAAGSVIQYITSFQAAMNSDTVINQVAQQAGVSSAAVRSGLSSQPSGVNSIIIKVSYTSKSKTRAPKIADLAARDTLDLLARPSLVTAQATLDADQAEYTAAKAAVDNFNTASGLTGPVLETYRAELGYVSQLQVAYEIDTLQGNPAAAGLKQLLQNEQARVTQLAGLVNQWTRLDDRESRDATSVADAQRVVAEAQAQLAVVQDPTAVAAGDTSKLSPLPDIIKLVGPVVVIALVLTICVIVLQESLKARRKRAAAAEDADHGQAASAPADEPSDWEVVRAATGYPRT